MSVFDEMPYKVCLTSQGMIFQVSMWHCILETAVGNIRAVERSVIRKAAALADSPRVFPRI